MGDFHRALQKKLRLTKNKRKDVGLLTSLYQNAEKRGFIWNMKKMSGNLNLNVVLYLYMYERL